MSVTISHSIDGRRKETPRRTVSRGLSIRPRRVKGRHRSYSPSAAGSVIRLNCSRSRALPTDAASHWRCRLLRVRGDRLFCRRCASTKSAMLRRESSSILSASSHTRCNAGALLLFATAGEAARRMPHGDVLLSPVVARACREEVCDCTVNWLLQGRFFRRRAIT